MEDKRLLRLVKKARFGDKEAFCELIKEKSRKIVFIATNLMGNKSDGEDAAQEAVITLARKIGTLKKAELFDAWMYRIIYNVCMDEKRKRKRKLDESGELETAIATIPENNSEVLPEQNLEEVAEKEAIMAALNELPERYRLCVLLYYYEEMSYAEIAETLQVSEQVVANTLNRAKEKLRSGFAEINQQDTEEVAGESGDSSSGIPSVAFKAGAFLPVAAISQAIAFNESVTVLPGAVASVTGVAGGVAMPKGLIVSRFIESAASKVVASLACIGILVGGASYSVQANQVPEPEPTPIVEPEPEPEPVATPVPEQVVEQAPSVPSATVDGLPEGSQTTVLAQGQDDAALAEFNLRKSDYEHMAEITSEGYRYTVYRSNFNQNDFILAIEKIAS